MLFYEVTNRCSYMKSIFFTSTFTLRVPGAIYNHHQKILNQATLGASSTDDTMDCTSGCKYSWKIELVITGVENTRKM